MLRKSPASNAWAAILKSAYFPQSSVKVTKLSNYFLFKSFLSSLPMIVATIKGLKGGNVELCELFVVGGTSVKPS